jgi:tetratricopeptide (TPR) repeat protein
MFGPMPHLGLALALGATLALAQSPAPGSAPGGAPAAAPAPDAAQQRLAPLLQAADAAYARRDAPGALDEVKAKLDEAERLAPSDYEVLWRQARLLFWESDDPAIGNDTKSKLGKRGWEYGERALRANPARVEGWHYAAAGMGNYSLGIGILRALGEGIEGKFKDRLSHAEKIDPTFEHGAIQTAWGRFWFKLPWPKYDAEKSERALLAALRQNPDNVRARVYLADLYRKEGHRPEARAQLEKAVAEEPGRYDAPEERRSQAIARSMLGEK